MYKSSKSEFDVIVIGGGISGLTSAAVLAKKGLSVALFERQHQIGGYVGSFKRGEYNFEASTHQISLNAYSWEKLKKYLDLDDVELVRSEFLYEAIHFDPLTYSIKKKYRLPWGLQKFETELSNNFPQHSEEIQNLMKLVSEIGWEIQTLRDVVREPAKCLKNIFHALMLKLDTHFSRYIAKFQFPIVAQNSEKTFADLLSGINDKDLQWLLNTYTMFTGSPASEMSAIVMLSLLNLYIESGPATIKGGTSALVESLKNTIQKNNGVIFTGTAVKSITIKNKKANGIITFDGDQYCSKYVISGINTSDTFLNLMDTDVLPLKYVNKIRGQKNSPSCIQVYVGIPSKYLTNRLGATTSFFDPTVDDFERHTMSIELNNYEKRTGTPFLVTTYGNEWGNGDKSTLVIAEFDTLKNWENLSESEYKIRKNKVEKTIIEKVEKITKIPLSDESKMVFTATPKTMKKYSGVPDGAILGTAATVDQSMLKRLQLQTPIKNLFLTGSYTSYTGVGSCLESGVTTAFSIVR